jgi:uncharacterized cupredoxin-like copper-binding protein
MLRSLPAREEAEAAMRNRFRTASILASLALAAAACTQAGASPTAGGNGATTVSVTLQEFSVLPDPTSAPAGDVTFHVTNDGPEDVHEFVIIRTDLAPDALPIGEDGTVDEEGEGMEVIDEIEDIPVGESQDVTASLDAGAYVLICNILESDEAHYQMGMRTAFAVE